MKQRKKPVHPQWALAHRKPGTELRFINGKHYLYEYKTIYDARKKRPKKISGSILGSITQSDGFIPSAKRNLEKSLTQKVFSNIKCKEYGISFLVAEGFKKYIQSLEKSFPQEWKEILAIAYCRFVYRCPLKSIPFRLETSCLPDIMEIDSFNEKTASGILNRIGGMPEEMNHYMRSFIRKGDYTLVDTTDVFSQSRLISIARKGYNNQLNYDSHFNLMYVYSATNRMPVFYRLLPGNIREVKAFKNTLLEIGLKKAVIIADKGFYSASNVDLMRDEGLNFIIPLKRDNRLISYQELENNTFKTGASFFIFSKRPVWFRKTRINNQETLYLYLDEKLRVKEEQDYLLRIKTHPETHSVEKYHQKKNHFGTMSMLANIKQTEEEVYQTYKSRGAIELLFDGMKNVLEADHTYMQNEQTLRGWMFVNHITLQWYQHLYIELKEKKLLKTISVNDYIQHLTDVKKIKINNRWYLNEFTSHTQKLMGKVGLKL